jgi:hypothetical protein
MYRKSSFFEAHGLTNSDSDGGLVKLVRVSENAALDDLSQNYALNCL